MYIPRRYLETSRKVLWLTVWNDTNLDELAGREKYRELRLIVVDVTGEFVLDVEASTGCIFCTPEWTLLLWRWRYGLVCRVHRTHHLAVLCLPQPSVWYHCNWVQSWHHRSDRSQQQQKHWDQHHYHLHLLIPCITRKPCYRREDRPRDAAVNFNTYRILQRHRGHDFLVFVSDHSNAEITHSTLTFTTQSRKSRHTTKRKSANKCYNRL